jgi:hypothetical protein
MHAAVLMISMPPAVEVPPVRVTMHMAIMVLAPRAMHLAVLMISMPPAVEVPPVRVAMHVPVMMAVPIKPVDRDALRLLHCGIANGCGRPEWRSLGCRRRERQGEARPQHGQHLHV